MIVAGLTGGIGSGKTAASEIFSRLGVPVIDADAIAHALTAPGQPVTNLIQRQWGDAVIADDGSIDRLALRKRVFQDPQQLQHLESILHPAIRQQIQQQIQHLKDTDIPYCLVVVPLLFEKHFDDLVDLAIIVDVPVEQQIQRVMARDHVDRQHVEKILAQQMPRHERLQRADHIIDNSGTLETLEQQVTALHNLLNPDSSPD